MDRIGREFEQKAQHFLIELEQSGNGKFARQDLDTNPSLTLFFARWLSAGLGDHAPKRRRLATPPKQARGTQGRAFQQHHASGAPRTQREKIVSKLEECPGLTRDELATLLEMRIPSCSGRVHELLAEGRLIERGTKQGFTGYEQAQLYLAA